MSREKILECLILKKQDFGEADHIITVMSREEGKLRCLVKAAKLPTSKLQPMLQPMFYSRVTLASSASNLPKAIRGQVIESFRGIQDDHEKVAAWFVVSELLARALPDGQANPQLFILAIEYLQFLNTTPLPASAIKLSITQFKIRALEALGLGIRLLSDSTPKTIWFSLDKGGFFDADTGADSFEVSHESYELFESLREQPSTIALLVSDTNDALFKLVTKFVTYQLEREIKASKFL